jgi:chemotaxis protein MotB
MARRKKQQQQELQGTWLATYGDMITLCLCFFVILFNPDEASSAQMQQIAASMQTGGLGASPGGLSMSTGRSSDLGNTVMALPSMDRGRTLGNAVRRAVSVFSPEIRSNKIRITHDERGLVITLAADAFFNPASARINVEQTRETLLRLGTFLASDDLRGRKFRIEGHTDGVDIEPGGPWSSNWELSAMRSINVLNYLTAIGINENRFQVAGFANTVPLASEDTAEGRAYNRRVDIVILDDGHL